MIEVRKKDNEPAASLIFRFSKKVKQSGLLKEFRRRRFRGRPVSRRKRRLSAQHRDQKLKEIQRLKKLGLA